MHCRLATVSTVSTDLSPQSWHNAQDLLRYWPRRDFDYSLNAPRGAFPNGWEGKGKLWSSKVFQFRSLTTTRTNPWKGDLFAPIGKDRLSSNQHFSGVKLAGKNFRVVLVVFWKIWNWKLIFCLMYRAATPISSASTLVFLSEFALFCNLLEMNPCTVTYRVFGMLFLPT